MNPAAFFESLLSSDTGCAVDACDVLAVTTNAYFSWRGYIPGTNDAIFFVMLGSLFAALLTLFLRSDRNVTVAGPLAIGIFIFFSGGDFIALQGAAAGLLLFAASTRINRTWLASILSLIAALLAQQFALANALIVTLFARSTSRPARLLAVSWIPALLVCSILISPPYLPLYPQGTQVVPDDEVPGMLRPFIGALSPIPFINREAVRSLYSPLSLGLLAAWCFWFLMEGRHSSRRANVVIGGLLAAACVLDTIFPESTSQHAPLASISRLLPHISFMVLVPWALAWGGGIIAFSAKRSTVLIVTLIAGALGAALVDRPTPDFHLTTREEKAVRSPSYYVLAERGSWTLDRRGLIDSRHFRPLRGRDVTIQVSHSPEKARRILSGRNDARWSPGRGRQEGDEWIHLRFTNGSRSLDGIELAVSKYVTDFPRGVRVLIKEECAENEPPRGEAYASIVDIPRWLGAIEFTADGFPYYRGRFDVKIYFPETVTAQCVLIQQTAFEPKADWSVAQIRVLESLRSSPR